MYTIELSYVLAISLAAIFYLLNGTIQYHQELYHFSTFHIEEEQKSHSPEEEKSLFQPEKFMRGMTILEDRIDTAKNEPWFECG
ncbi:MAG: hypothetical protein ACTTHL_05500 [Oribacterium sp.]